MDLSFLNHFLKRMKHVGTYALLFRNSLLKTTWKQYVIDEFYEQCNLIFIVLLYIMEQSLKDEQCTMDDIGGFIETINKRWFKKSLSYDKCKELGHFIVNIILGNEGKVMYFQGYDFDEGDYKDIHISFVNNKIIYLDGDIRRTSYYLTDDGYDLMLSTLELEGNMKLTIHEMIFKLHIEKSSYDKAVDDIKNIFNLLRIQIQKIQEAMRKIKQNALNYSGSEYKSLLEDNLATIGKTKKQFIGYRENIRNRVKELEEQDINIKKLDKKDSENLSNLKIIEGYLNRSIDEHQKILSTHFDFKALYSKELEELSQMTLIKRFDLRSEFYDKVLNNQKSIMNLEYFLRPLLKRDLDQTYNLSKALEFQKPIRARQFNDEDEILSFDEDMWLEEQNAKMRDKLNKYKDCLNTILVLATSSGEITLQEIQNKLDGNYKTLIPTVEIFKEVIIELLKSKNINIQDLKLERDEHLNDQTIQDFQLNECILGLIESNITLKSVSQIMTYRLDAKETVSFENILNENEESKRLLCSNIWIKII